MRVFVSEFVCGGAWPGERIDTSLAREGRAMLTALLDDVSRIPQCQVVSTWDVRLGPAPRVNADVRLIASPLDEANCFDELVRDCDVTWVIAPETAGILRQRREQFDRLDLERPRLDSPRRFIGPTAQAIQLCTEKDRLCEHLTRAGLATPPTRRIDVRAASLPRREGLIVVKPNDGAGSQDTALIRDDRDWQRFQAELVASSSPVFIEQPFIAGRAVSVALLIAEDGTIREFLPVAEQRLSEDRRFRYLGGSVPAAISEQSVAAIQRLAERACRCVRGLTGYVGCDIVLPDDDLNPQPVLIEINPRLTSSYLGYRVATGGNLAERLLFDGEPLRWNSSPTQFSV